MKDSAVYPGFRWLVLLSTCMAYISLCAMMAFPPLLPIIERSLGITTTAAAQLLSVSILTAALSLSFVGAFADRYGIMPSLVVALLFSTIPSVLMPFIGTSFLSVFILRALTGIAAGFSFCVMSTVLAIWFPMNEKGLAAGMMGASVSIGSMGVVVAPYIHAVIQSWQQTVAWLSVPGWIGLIITLIAWARQPKPPVQAQPELSDTSAFKRALMTPVTWIGVFMTFFAAWVMQGLYQLAPPYFAYSEPKGIGLGPIMAGNLMLGVMIAGIIGPVVAGLLQDKAFKGNSKPVMLMGFILCAVFAYLTVVPAVYTNMTFLVISLVLAGVGTQFTYALIPVYVSRSYPITIVAKVIGLWMGVGMFGGVAGVALGVAIERFGKYAP